MPVRAVFKMTVEKPNQSNYVLRPITTGTNSAMNQSQFLAITCNSPEAREKSQVHSAIGLGFASHWLKPGATLLSQSLSIAIAIAINVITFDSHLKTALIQYEKQTSNLEFIDAREE